MKNIQLVLLVTLGVILINQSFASSIPFYSRRNMDPTERLKNDIPKIREVADYFTARCGSVGNAKKLNQAVFTFFGCSFNAVNIHELNENLTKSELDFSLYLQITDNSEEARECTSTLLKTVQPCFSDIEIKSLKDFESLLFDKFFNKNLLETMMKLKEAEEGKCIELAFKFKEMFAFLKINRYEIKSAVEVFNSTFKFMVDKPICTLRTKLINFLQEEDLSECKSKKIFIQTIIDSLENYCADNEILNVK